jgi:hypothetical protein
MEFYDLPQGDEMFPEWSGDLLIAGPSGKGAVVRLSIEDGRVVEEERLARGIGRVRDVAVDTNGSVLFVTDASGWRALPPVPQLKTARRWGGPFTVQRQARPQGLFQVSNSTLAAQVSLP